MSEVPVPSPPSANIPSIWFARITNLLIFYIKIHTYPVGKKTFLERFRNVPYETFHIGFILVSGVTFRNVSYGTFLKRFIWNQYETFHMERFRNVSYETNMKRFKLVSFETNMKRFKLVSFETNMKRFILVSHWFHMKPIRNVSEINK